MLVEDELELPFMLGQLWVVLLVVELPLEPELPVVELPLEPELLDDPLLDELPLDELPDVAVVTAWCDTAGAVVLVAPATSIPMPRLSPSVPATTPAARTGLRRFMSLLLPLHDEGRSLGVHWTPQP